MFFKKCYGLESSLRNICVLLVLVTKLFSIQDKYTSSDFDP